MKKLLILILITLWAFVDAKAQNNYYLANSVEGIQIELSGSGSGLSNQYLKDTSEFSSTQQLWFLSPGGYDPANGRYVRAGQLNVGFTNLTNVWKKITIYDFTGTTLIRSQNIAPNATLNWGFGTYPQEDKRLDAAKDYYWKFENVTTQNVTCNADTKNMPASNSDYIDVLDNDLNLPSGSDCRLKAGQTLMGGLTVIKDQFRGLKVTTSSQQGTFSFVYEVVNNGSVLGEATATIVVSAPSSSCTLVILSEKLQAGSQTIHEFTLYSPNAQISPYNYAVRTTSYQGTIVKSGTTPSATSNKEIIDFGTLPTGTYYVSFTSSISNCIDFKTVFHINPADACNASVISIDKVNGTNNYSVNSSFSNTVTIKTYLTDAQISNGSPLLTQTGISTQSFTINLSTLPSGSYYVNIEGEGKYCKAQKSFDHTLVAISMGATKLETWTKFIHNYKDNWIITGKSDYESGRDKFGLQSLPEKAQNVVWKAFISEFDNAGNSPKAKALIGFRKDTTRNEVGVSVGVTANSIILQQRSTKSGATNILATVNNITMPVWVRLTKIGNDFVADYSKDLNMNPVYTELGRISGAFSGFTNYQKFIGTASARTDVIASARFQGQLGGTVLFNAPIVTITPPVIASNVASPTNGQSIILSTTTSCIAPSTNNWNKNSEANPFSAGATVNVQAFNTDSYYAKCQIGLNKSVRSNIFTIAIGNVASCNNGSRTFSISSAVYASGNVSFSYDASNLNNTNWSILNGSTVVKTGTLRPSSNTETISSGALSAGNYIFKLDGISCTGTAQKSFVVGGSSSAPTVSCSPASPISGNNITLTASGCVGSYSWFNISGNTTYGSLGSDNTLMVLSAVSGDNYYATCQGGREPSNYIRINSRMSEGSDMVAPTLTANIANPTDGQSVILTSSGCNNDAVNQFFANDNLIGLGNSITITAIRGTSYSAKCALICESLGSSVYVSVANNGGNNCKDGLTYPLADSNLKGSVEYGAANCDYVSGWALDINNSNNSVVVDIYIGGVFIISTIANLGPRPDLASAFGAGFSYKYFNISLPSGTNEWWKNGTNKPLEVRFGGTKTKLDMPNGAFTINCAGTGSGVCN